MRTQKRPVTFLLLTCCAATYGAWIYQRIPAPPTEAERQENVHQLFATARAVCPVVTGVSVEAVLIAMTAAKQK